MADESSSDDEKIIIPNKIQNRDDNTTNNDVNMNTNNDSSDNIIIKNDNNNSNNNNNNNGSNQTNGKIKLGFTSKTLPKSGYKIICKIASTAVSTTSGRGKKKKDFTKKEGQKHEMPNELNGAFIFYSSLLYENEDSIMAQKWLMEHGCFEDNIQAKFAKKFQVKTRKSPTKNKDKITTKKKRKKRKLSDDSDDIIQPPKKKLKKDNKSVKKKKDKTKKKDKNDKKKKSTKKKKRKKKTSDSDSDYVPS